VVARSSQQPSSRNSLYKTYLAQYQKKLGKSLKSSLQRIRSPRIQRVRASRGQGKPSGLKNARSSTQAKKLCSREGDEDSGISDDHMSIFYDHLSIFFQTAMGFLTAGTAIPKGRGCNDCFTRDSFWNSRGRVWGKICNVWNVMFKYVWRFWWDKILHLRFLQTNRLLKILYENFTLYINMPLKCIPHIQNV
jgi:hypothetical protein